MSKVMHHHNFRVEVQLTDDLPNRLVLRSGAWEKQSAQTTALECLDQLERDIRKLLNAANIDCVGDVSMCFDTRFQCEHCGYEWGEKSKDYNGGCCDADQDAEDKQRAAPSQDQSAQPPEQPEPTR